VTEPSPHRSYFHSCAADADPERLLDPAQQFTEPWGGHEHGPCDKCGGRGIAGYECRSCLETGALPDCPACQGGVRFEETCPTCEGTGEITHTRRRGIAVFPTREGLYRYLAEKEAAVEGRMIVELQGRLSEERDLDADTGALLLLPERIVASQPLDAELVAMVRDAGPG
jgi:hypothetical protein